MNNVLIIYNPNSGKGKGEKYANKIKNKFESLSINAQLFAGRDVEDNFNFFKKLKEENKTFDCLIILGGDGTVGRTVNSMLKNELNFPIATFPLGTANDFSWFLKMKKNVNKLVDCIVNSKPVKCDVATANGQYVINVIGGGLYTNGYTNYKNKSKKAFGKLAYWWKALTESFKVRYQRFSINIDGEEIRDELCFFSILNVSSAGGMKKLGIDAGIADGYFEFVAFKRCNLFQRFFLFLSVIMGKHKKNKHVIYKKGRQFSIKTIHSQTRGYSHCDIDGDCGPNYPLHVKVCKGAISVYTRNKKLIKN